MKLSLYFLKFAFNFKKDFIYIFLVVFIDMTIGTISKYFKPTEYSVGTKRC